MRTVVQLILFLLTISGSSGNPILNDVQTIQGKPYENPELFEGDMRFPEDSTQTSRGVARRGASVPWTNGIIPYEILPGYASTEQAFIIATMQKMERLIAVGGYKCIEFRPKTSSDPYYISITNGNGCSSYVGQNTGITMTRTVTLQHPGCIDEGRIMHELLHALGFYHEQSRPDRDSYVRINYANIQTGMVHNFDKYTTAQVDTQNTSYDYASVMQYESTAFSSNGRPTIEPLVSNVTIGQRDNMSAIDILEVRLFYNCSAQGVTLPPIPTTTTSNLYVINTTIESSLTSNSPRFSRFNGSGSNYYYEQFLVTVPVTGSYVFMSKSSLDTYGYFYDSTITYGYYQLIAYDDNSAGQNQFKMQIYLRSSTQYMMRVTTFNQYVIGNYTIIASGINAVSIRRDPGPTVTTAAPTNPDTQKKCFSADSQVKMLDGSYKNIALIRPGDLISAPTDSFIVEILQRHPSEQTLFYTIKTKTGKAISLTANHLIATQSTNGYASEIVYKFAKNIKVNDYLINDELQPEQVIRITQEFKFGYYAPMSNAGTLIVNGLMASCYASITSHRFAHWMMAPLRFQYTLRQAFGVEHYFNEEIDLHPFPSWLLHMTETFIPSGAGILAP